MSNKLTFGKHETKTFEWLFFNKLAYARYIHDNRIYRQEHAFDEQEGEYFAELYRRASNLGGTCCHCKERPVTRMGLTLSSKAGSSVPLASTATNVATWAVLARDTTPRHSLWKPAKYQPGISK